MAVHKVGVTIDAVHGFWGDLDGAVGVLHGGETRRGSN